MFPWHTMLALCQGQAKVVNKGVVIEGEPIATTIVVGKEGEGPGDGFCIARGGGMEEEERS